MTSAQQFTQVTELAQRVRRWEDRISPILNREVTQKPSRSCFLFFYSLSSLFPYVFLRLPILLLNESEDGGK